MRTLPVLAALVASCAARAAGVRLDDEQFVVAPAIPSTPINIAVIGAGAGGASTAYHLHKFAASAGLDINVTVFERNAYIGGRSTTVNAYGDPKFPVELGASIFVEANRILRDAVAEFGLSTCGLGAAADDNDSSIPGASLAVWDGRQIVFAQKSGGGWWDSAKLLWRYGLAPLRTQRLMKAVVGKFLTLYDAPRFPFASLTQVAQDAGLLAVTAATGEQYLTENGITGAFTREIIQASTRVNYAQNLRYIHGLEAMVCMAAENAMSVTGGNWQIFAAMINASQATVALKTQVTGLERQEDGSYIVEYEPAGPSDHSTTSSTARAPQSQHFDSVVLAAPYQYAGLTHSPADAISTPDTIPYVQLHVTLFSSPHLLSPEAFGLEAEQAAPRVVLTTLPADEDPRPGAGGVGSTAFFSLSLLRPAVNPTTGAPEYLYKMFSPEPPTAEYLSGLLAHGGAEDAEDEERITWLYRTVWNSYPYELPRVTFERIRLDQTPEEEMMGIDPMGLWYTSGMESFISTMETSALMGANVARLIVDAWQMARTPIMYIPYDPADFDGCPCESWKWEDERKEDGDETHRAWRDGWDKPGDDDLLWRDEWDQVDDEDLV